MSQRFLACALTLLFALLLPACTQQPAGAGSQAKTCSIAIEVGRSNGRLACGATLSTEHQHDLVVAAMANHELVCRQPRDTVRLQDLAFEYAPDGQGGWRRTAATCTLRYMKDQPVTRSFGEDYAAQIEGILLRQDYCDLGRSCTEDCGCDEACCETGDCCHARNEPCSQRIATGGVIIAVVSSLPQE